MRAAADDASLGAVEPDDLLVVRTLGGDTGAFATLVERYQRVLHRCAMAMVLDSDVASDMVQDAFVRAYVNLRTCRDPMRFRAWLLQTLRNRCLDYLKAAGRRSVPLEAADAVADTAAAADERVERRRVADAVRRALAALPHAQREAFVMHYVHDVPYDELAGTLGVSVSALKMRALRARQALVEALAAAHVTRRSPGRLMGRGRFRVIEPASEEER
jgi:RNA polymerase sigma-70 factor, ECF subfamily